MLRRAIHIGKDCHAHNIQLTQRPDNAHRNLPAVSNKNFTEHARRL